MTCEIVQMLVGQSCWYVSHGGSTAPTFELVMGQRIPREAQLQNAAHPDEFRLNRGSHSLLVWCSWRLQEPTKVLTTSDNVADLSQLDKLTDATLVIARCSAPAWDLELQFSNGLVLLIFSDNHGPDPTASQNWELWVPGMYARAGLGEEWLEEIDKP